MCYNGGVKIVVPCSTENTARHVTSLMLRRLATMDTLSPHAENGKIPHFVYELVDPRDNSIFYVGITVDLLKRFKQHMRQDGANPRKDQRIQEILASGHLPIMRTKEQCLSLEPALERESYWIEHYLQQGIDLLNLATVPVPLRKFTSPFGRKAKNEQVREVVIHRKVHGAFPDGLSTDMRNHYEFFYFTCPKRNEASDPAKYAQHKRSYERGRRWIAEHEASKEQAT